MNSFNFLENCKVNDIATYNYFNTPAWSFEKEIEIEDKHIYENTRLGKFNIFKGTFANIQDYDQFSYPIKKLLTEVITFFKDYTAVVKTKSAIIQGGETVIDRVFFKLTINNKKREIWIEPVLYAEPE
jgi:hypothetical protein